MTRYYESGIPRSNYHGAMTELALGGNNHISEILIDTDNEYGVRIIVRCWSELDDEDHWYSIRDHKGDVFVAEMNTLDGDASKRVQVWSDGAERIFGGRRETT